mgnify:CR=1 FL=1
MKLPQPLLQLASLFYKNKHNLYVVGGAVRNYLLHLPFEDIDITSDMQIEEIIAILENTPYIVKIKNAKLQTAIISYGAFNFEYATFRDEKYLNENSRTPSSVTFVDNIKTDSFRRDFTCNAVYYDIIRKQYIDFHNGLNDISLKQLKTIKEANLTFTEDTVRMLRLIRFSLELNFNIEKNTFNALIDNLPKLKNLNPQSKQIEFEKILQSNFSYPSLNIKNEKKIFLLKDLDIFPYIFGKQFALNLKNLSNDEFTLSFNCKNKKDALTFFLIDYYTLYLNKITLENNQDLLENHNITSKNKTLLTKSRFTKKDFDNMFNNNYFKIEKQYLKELYSLAKAYTFKNIEKNVRFYIYINNSCIDKICDIFLLNNKTKPIAKTIKQEFEIIKKLNIPLTEKDLNINGNDISKHFPNLDKKRYSQILHNMIYACLFENLKNTKQDLISYIENKIINHK